MSNHVAGVVAVYVMFITITFMGAWDGLVRHHIRVRPGEWLPHLTLRRLSAVVVGACCLVLLLFIGDLARRAIPPTVEGCGDLYCVYVRILVPPFTNVLDAFVIVLFLGIFIGWLFDIGDREGPFRTRLLAWGVWYREREIVERVRLALREKHKPPVDVDAVLATSDAILRRFHGTSPTLGRYGPSGESLSRAQAIAMITQSSIGHGRRGIPDSTRRMVLEIITGYAIDQLESAERRWPWRRRLFTVIR